MIFVSILFGYVVCIMLEVVSQSFLVDFGVDLGLFWNWFWMFTFMMDAKKNEFESK